MGFESIRLITFDCYGTLIDWENGMLAALRPLFLRDGHRIPDTQILELYGEIEAELESGPYLLYREILAKTAREIGVAGWTSTFQKNRAVLLPIR